MREASAALLSGGIAVRGRMAASASWPPSPPGGLLICPRTCCCTAVDAHGMSEVLFAIWSSSCVCNLRCWWLEAGSRLLLFGKAVEGTSLIHCDFGFSMMSEKGGRLSGNAVRMKTTAGKGRARNSAACGGGGMQALAALLASNHDLEPWLPCPCWRLDACPVQIQAYYPCSRRKCVGLTDWQSRRQRPCC